MSLRRPETGRPGVRPAAATAASRADRCVSTAATAAPAFAAALCAAALVSALLAVAVMLSAGCDDGEATRTYHDERYGFSLTLDDRFEEWQRADVSGQGAFAVTFADKDGPVVGDRYLDAVMLAALDMGTDLGAVQTESMREMLREQSARALAMVGSNVRTWPVTDVTVNGVEGSVIPFNATVGDREVTGWSYLFVRGRYLYLVIVTSGDDTWGGNEATLRRIAESFRLDPQ